jgi:restriction endonuclease
MQLTDFHAKYFAHELTRRYSSDRVEKLATVLADAQVDLVRILKESNRLPELFNNPQRFMDRVASILKQELHRLLVDGVKYERIDSVYGADWEMVLFKNEELINYLTALQVSKSVYEYVSYDSQIEREFAKRLVSGWRTHLAPMCCVSLQSSPVSNCAAAIRQCGSRVEWAASRARP